MQVHQQRAERPSLERIVNRLVPNSVDADREKATVLSLWRTARHDAANTIWSETGPPRLITSGWAGWMRYGEGGRRQIFLFLMPGDFIVPALFQLECCDLVSLTPMRSVDAASLVNCLTGPTPFAGATIADDCRYYRLLLLDHLTRLTAGCTTRSVAHLLVELHARSMRSGACIEGRFSLPIGQRIIASALGRSTVQVNKIIQQFQSRGLISVGYDWIQLHDPQRLHDMSGMTHSLLNRSPPAAGLSPPREVAAAF